jgi:hypothetical protein
MDLAKLSHVIINILYNTDREIVLGTEAQRCHELVSMYNLFHWQKPQLSILVDINIHEMSSLAIQCSDVLFWSEDGKAFMINR